jgi:uncharacterized LabA/DUF88 family protein
MNKTSAKGVYAFIDSQNLNLGVQRMGWKMDWRKFRLYLEKQYGVTHAYMFIGYMLEHEDLYEKMYDHGYLVVLKPTLDIKPSKESDIDNKLSPEEPKQPMKGNVDVDLTLYAMKEMPNYETAIIVSGDGDFYSLAEYLREQKKLKHIMAPNWKYSSLLKDFEPYIVRIDQLRRELAYRDRHNGGNRSKFSKTTPVKNA